MLSDLQISLLSIHFILFQQMISQVSKLQYYQLKNIPMVVQPQPLELLPPLSQHLLQPIPYIGPDVEQALASQEMEKNMSLELANANKIIHTLEEEIELLQEKNSQCEDQLNEIQCDNVRQVQHVEKLTRKLEVLEHNIRRNDYQWSKKYESERNYLLRLLTQQEDKAKEFENLLNAAQISHRQELSSLQQSFNSAIQQAENKSKDSEKMLQDALKEITQKFKNSEEHNLIMKRRLMQAEELNREDFQVKDSKIREQEQTISTMKSDYEHLRLNLNAKIETLERSYHQLKSSSWLREDHANKTATIEKNEKQRLAQQLRENEQLWKNRYESIFAEKEKLRHNLSEKSQMIVDKELLLSQTKSEASRFKNFYEDLLQQHERKMEEHKRQVRQLKSFHEQIQEESMNMMRSSIQRRVVESNEKCKKELTSIHEIQKIKYQDHIKGLEESKAKMMERLKNGEHTVEKMASEMERIKKKYEEKELEKWNLEQNVQNLIEKELERQRFKFSNEIQEISEQYQRKISQIKNHFDSQQKKFSEKYGQKVQEHEELLKKYTYLISEVEEINQVKKSLINELQEKHEQIKFLMDNNESFERLIEEKENENHKITRNLEVEVKKMSDVCGKVRSLEDQINIFKGKLNDSQAALKEAKETINNKNIEIQEMKCELKKSESFIHSERQQYNLRMQNIQEILQEKENQIAYLSKQRENLQISLQEKHSYSEEHWQKIQDNFQERLQEMKADCERRVSEIKSMLEEKNLSFENLQNQYFELQRQFSEEKNIFEFTLSRQEELTKELKSSYEKTQEQHKEIVSKLKEKKDIISRLQIDLNKLEIQKKEQSSKLDLLSEKLEVAEQACKKLSTEKAFEENHAAKQKKQLEDLQEKYCQMEKQYQSKVEEKNKQLRSMRSQMRRNMEKSEIEAVQSERKNKIQEEEMQLLQNEYARVEKILSQYQTRNTEQNNRIQELMSQLSSVQSKNEILKNKNGVYQEKEKEQEIKISELTLKLVAIESQLLSKEDEMESLRREIQEFKKKIEKGRKQKDHIEEDLKKKSNECTKIEKILEQLKKDFDNERQKHEDQLRKILKESDERVKEAEKEIEQKKDWELQQMDRHMQMNKKRIEDLEKYINELKVKLHENGQIAQLEKERYIDEIRKKEKITADWERKYEKLRFEYSELLPKYRKMSQLFDGVYENIKECRSDLSPNAQAHRQFRTSPKRERKTNGISATRKQAHTYTHHKNLKDSEEVREEITQEFPTYSVLEIRNPIKTLTGKNQSVVKSESNIDMDDRNLDDVSN